MPEISQHYWIIGRLPEILPEILPEYCGKNAHARLWRNRMTLMLPWEEWGTEREAVVVEQEEGRGDTLCRNTVTMACSTLRDWMVVRVQMEQQLRPGSMKRM